MKSYKITQEALRTYYKYEKPEGSEYWKSVPYKVNIQGRIIAQNGYDTILLATPTLITEFISSHYLTELIRKGLVEEIDLTKEHKIHPHLFKPIKEQILKLLQE